MSGQNDFERYLAAKRTVDGRALNRGVLDRLETALADAGGTNGDEAIGSGADESEADESEADDGRVAVLDVGAGIGGALEHLLERDVLPPRVDYTLLDARGANVAAAREHLPRWATDRGYAVTATDAGFDIAGTDIDVALSFVVGDAFEHVETGRWDLLVGQAFLDLFDARRAFDALCGALVPGGLYYFPITFDGGTTFQPPMDPALDACIEHRYHEHIGDGGDSRAGRHLLARACERTEVLVAGSSDWVVHPRDGAYPADERFFLEYIVDTVAGALAGTDLDGDALADWAETRHRQVDRGELVYIAHQLDVLGRVPDSGRPGADEALDGP